MNSIIQLLNNFNQFRQSFNGDARTEIEKLLQSGNVNQNQLNEAQQLAKQLQGLFK